MSTATDEEMRGAFHALFGAPYSGGNVPVENNVHIDHLETLRRIAFALRAARTRGFSKGYNEAHHEWQTAGSHHDF